MTEKENYHKGEKTHIIYTCMYIYIYIYILPDFSGAHILSRQLQWLELYMYLTKTGETVKNEKAY